MELPEQNADDIQAFTEILGMTREELDVLDYEVKKWVCMVKGCCNGTYVRDYGIPNTMYHPRKSIGWIDSSDDYWMCGKHLKFIKRLQRIFSQEHIETRLLDLKKQIFIPLKYKYNGKTNY